MINKYGYENSPVSANQNEKLVMCRVFIAQRTVRSTGSSADLESDSSRKEGNAIPLLHTLGVYQTIADKKEDDSWVSEDDLFIYLD